MTQPLPMITISGPPAVRGESYGRQAAVLIARALAMYRDELDRKGLPWDQAQQLARQFLPSIEAYDEDIALEMHGIARGAGQPVEAIVILNARTELLFWNERERHGAAPDPDALEPEECTSALALPQSTADGHLLHAQNWDWQPACAEHSLVVRIQSGRTADSLNFVEAGQLARHGFNGEGVAITAMGLHSSQDYGRLGIPNPLIRRKVLDSGGLAEAIGVIYRSQRSFSHCLSISHAGGEAFNFETTPDHVFWQAPDNGLLVHSNHFKNPLALAKVEDVNIARCPDTLYRDSRVRKALERLNGHLTVDHFKQVFADTFGLPNSVLRHPAARPGGMTSATVYTLIMDTTERRAWLAPTPYRNARYTEYSLA